MKKLAFIFLLVPFFGCSGETVHENVKNIIGTWNLESLELQGKLYPVGNEKNPNESFSWQFNEDGTYTAHNAIGDMEIDNFDNSNPLRKSGDFKGFYEVDRFLKIREQYRGVSFFDRMLISGNSMKCEYSRKNNNQDVVKLVFTKK